MEQQNLILIAVAVFVVFFLATRLLGTGSRKQLLAKLAAGALVIDVRTPGEFSGGHYKGARNIPLDSLNGQLAKLGATDKPLIVYCASGARSAQAAQLLRRAGFVDVTNAGGLGRMPG
ncbi:MAG: hypothetical protein A2087_12730 [Spirochaetes bacterium GWD1_61_31]|nr:MAG: hypothetical protein A2Y37_05770 [Spirochaetes bacterium GWB1_60_80]OHD34526.1 MAG: hypothetical protein A2004_08890 [Spirochaetes bacterium GWC1_61_12]OHD38129.1 MAG: hypothetical protein A2087_12730 [Spirochaetes bacterium GWD1_61_31]OHD42971.1 MAG: hypothetical protein A2Y35_14190 [Spirochaetes bacterium GWE1_60_18]OHD58696.1 MAG: hypothetical protein A2Y32_02095 [Spirochaetes bacterium GWF1_60_12]HAP44182.1 rhodanese-like domain-containing protein [Spirochaetaceae bacterium]